MKSFLNVVFIVLCSSFQLNAQDFWETTEKARKWYAQHENFILHVQISDILQNSGEMISTTKGVMKRRGTDYYSHLDNQETLISEGRLLIADHENNNIYINMKYNNNEAHPNIYTELGKADSLYKLVYDISLITDVSEMISYRLVSKYDPKNEVEMTFLKSGQLYRIIYYFSGSDAGADSRTEITYYDCNFSPKYSVGEFSVNKYISVSNSNIVGAGKFRNYQIIKLTQNEGS